MTVIDAFVAMCLSAHMADTNKQIRQTIKRCQERLPAHERHKLEPFRRSSNPRQAILLALSLL